MAELLGFIGYTGKVSAFRVRTNAVFWAVPSVGSRDRQAPERRNVSSPLILDKVLDNFSTPGDQRVLTSLSKSKVVALRHAGPRGWLIGEEVDPVDLLDVQPFLERGKSRYLPSSEEWVRVDEALEMARSDQEVFMKYDAAFTTTDVEMVGSYSPGADLA